VGLHPQDTIAHIVAVDVGGDSTFEAAVNEAFSRRIAEHAEAGKEPADGHRV
jgi:hypothetical protein